MSPPDTNVQKQAKRHRGPLVGIVVACLIALAAGLWIRSNDSLTGADDAPEGTATVETETPTN